VAACFWITNLRCPRAPGARFAGVSGAVSLGSGVTAKSRLRRYSVSCLRAPASGAFARFVEARVALARFFVRFPRVAMAPPGRHGSQEARTRYFFTPG